MFRQGLIRRNFQTVIGALESLAEINGILGERFKANSYRTAIASLKSFEAQRLGSGDGTKGEIVLASSKDVGGLPGIGAKIHAKIDELIRSGELQELKALQERPLISAVRNLTQVHGIGPQKAKQLFEAHAITSVDELKAAVNGPTPRVSLSEAQLAGLEFVADIALRIPSAEVAEHERMLQNGVRDAFNNQYVATVCGSFRRGLATSGDIDALLALKPSVVAAAKKASTNVDVLDALVKYLQQQGGREAPYWLRTLAIGPTKCMGICRLKATLPARRIDLRVVRPEAYPTALLYFTGSKAFNVRMRSVASANGFVLNEYGLFRSPSNSTTPHRSGDAKKKGGEGARTKKQPQANRGDNADAKASSGGDAQYDEALRVSGIRTEQDVFKAIGMPFVPPTARIA